ncbi:MAG TPA: hypothetical protein VGI56_06910 [Galbitalea sp.]
MTTFQDPPPQSRRAVRQGERGDSQTESVPYTFDPSAGTPQEPPAAPQTGRRAQVPTAEERIPAPPAGSYPSQPPSGDSILANQPPPGMPAQSDQQAYKVRDFSPEGRRAAINREQFQSVADAPPPMASFPAQAESVDLDYHTQAAGPLRARGTSTPQPFDEDPQNHTLSRRELRELRAAAETQAPALQLPEPIDTLLNSGPIEIPTLAPPPGQSQALAEAMAEFDLLTRSRREADARARDAQVASLQTTQAPQVAPPAPMVQATPPEYEPSAYTGSVPVPSAPAPTGPVVNPSFAPPPPPAAFAAAAPTVVSVPFVPVSSVQAPPEPVPSLQVPSVQVPPEPVPSLPVASANVPSVQAPPEPQAAAAPVFIEPQSAPTTRPTGHWSVQAAMDDDELPFENTLSRTVGSNTSAITTSALVLPSVPQPNGMINAVTSTGEILVTGSIDLPRSLGTTGAHPHRVDNSDFEDDPLDSEVSSPDSAPIRAIRAVSTHTSTRGVIENKGPQNNNRLLTAVIIAASVLAVGVVGFLVFAFATHQL